MRYKKLLTIFIVLLFFPQFLYQCPCRISLHFLNIYIQNPIHVHILARQQRINSFYLFFGTANPTLLICLKLWGYKYFEYFVQFFIFFFLTLLLCLTDFGDHRIQQHHGHQSPSSLFLCFIFVLVFCGLSRFHRGTVAPNQET